MHSRGASTWSLRTADHFATYEATAAADASSIWAVGAPGGILHSTDAGANWTLQTRGPLLRAISVSAIDASTAWAAGFGGTIMRTADAGTTWTLVRDESAFVTFTGDRIYDVGGVSASVAWAAGVGQLLKTTDGGASWVAQAGIGSTAISTVTVVSASVIWIAGSNGFIAKSLDGGARTTCSPSAA